MEYGHQLLDDKAKSLGYGKLDEAALQRVEVAYGETDREELFYRIGIGAVKLDNLGEVLKTRRVSFLRKIFSQKEKPKKTKKNSHRIR